MFSTVEKRGLSQAEIALFPPDFLRHIDPQRLRLINRAHNPFAIGKVLVRGYDIYWKDYPADFTREPLSVRAILMHELCHVWQYATRRLTAWRYLTHPKNWAYSYVFDPRKDFDGYPIEKQADLLQDWYYMNHRVRACRYDKRSAPPSLAQINSLIPFMWDMGDIEPNMCGIAPPELSAEQTPLIS